MPASADPRAAAIRSALERLIAQSPGPRLPGLRALAARFGVSAGRMAAILGGLRDEGRLDYCRGRPITIVTGDPAGPAPVRAPAARERLAARLRAALAEGDLPLGHPLPKFAVLASAHDVSRRTLRGALEELRSAGLLHRRGRTWIAGPKPAPRPARRPGGGPVIGLLQCAESGWGAIIRSERTAEFARVFLEEAGRGSVELRPVFLTRPEHARIQPWGEESAGEYLRGLGRRLAGALIVGQSYEYYDFGQGQDVIFDAIRWLSAFGRPVVWFDSHDEPRAIGHPSHAEKYRDLFGTRGVARRFTRCHVDEAAAVALALERLAAHGHRKVGMPNHRPDYAPWVGRRLGMAREAGARLGVEIRFQGPPDPGREGADGGLRYLRRYASPRARRLAGALARARREDTRLSPEERRWLSRLAPVLAPLLADGQVTALLCPNDRLARDYYMWARYLGLEVPGDLSLISFDNHASALHPWPISSVDFGFGYLGFKAFHTLMGDLPLDRRGGDIPSRPQLNHEGSLGPARG